MELFIYNLKSTTLKTTAKRKTQEQTISFMNGKYSLFILRNAEKKKPTIADEFR